MLNPLIATVLSRRMDLSEALKLRDAVHVAGTSTAAEFPDMVMIPMEDRTLRPAAPGSDVPTRMVIKTPPAKTTAFFDLNQNNSSPRLTLKLSVPFAEFSDPENVAGPLTPEAECVHKAYATFGPDSHVHAVVAEHLPQMVHKSEMKTLVAKSKKARELCLRTDAKKGSEPGTAPKMLWSQLVKQWHRIDSDTGEVSEKYQQLSVSTALFVPRKGGKPSDEELNALVQLHHPSSPIAQYQRDNPEMEPSTKLNFKVFGCKENVPWPTVLTADNPFTSMTWVGSFAFLPFCVSVSPRNERITFPVILDSVQIIAVVGKMRSEGSDAYSDATDAQLAVMQSVFGNAEESPAKRPRTDESP